jgi:hypothetical protein
MLEGGNAVAVVHFAGHVVVVMVKPRSCTPIHELVTASPRMIRAEQTRPRMVYFESWL